MSEFKTAVQQLLDKVSALEAENARLRAAPKVKSLEWHKSEMTLWNGDYHTVPTVYAIRCSDENGWVWEGFGAHGYCASPESAKAAAQQDYESRILAALESNP